METQLDKNMNFIYILFASNLVLIIINLILTFYIGAFLVRFRRDLTEVISSLLEINSEPLENKQPEENSPKTWDQKYEEEIQEASRRLAQQQGDF
jgi:hypothetical protein